MRNAVLFGRTKRSSKSIKLTLVVIHTLHKDPPRLGIRVAEASFDQIQSARPALGFYCFLNIILIKFYEPLLCTFPFAFIRAGLEVLG